MTSLEQLSPATGPAPALVAALGAFSVLLAASMFGGLASGDIDFLRTHATAWSMTLLASPAMYLFVARFRRQPLNDWWRMFWTAGLCMNVVHFYFGLFHLHDGEPTTVFQRQGFMLAFSIFFFLGLWALDVLAAWIRVRRPTSWIARRVPDYGWFNSFAFVVGFLTFFISTVIFRNDDNSLVVGLVMTGAVVGGLVHRFCTPAPTVPA